MKLREYRSEDAKIICKWITDEESMYEWSADRISKYPFDAEDLHAHHQHTIKTERFTPFTFVDENDLPTGHIAIRYPDPEDESSVRFGFVIIDPERRRKGLGRMMLAAACEYSKNVLKAERATLAVFTRNEKALRCYRASGFHQTGEAQICKLPVGEWECVILEKEL